MEAYWTHAFASVLGVSSLSLLAILALLVSKESLSRIIPPLIGLAVGALIGDALIHLIPDAFKDSRPLEASFSSLAGYFLSFGFEKAFRLAASRKEHRASNVKSQAVILLFATTVHNFIDGMVIGTAYLAGETVGIATTLAIVLHEIPHELGDFGVLVDSGLTVKRAILLNCLTAIAAIIGTATALMLGRDLAGFSRIMIPFTAGNFLYLAGTDLMPGLLESRGMRAEALRISMLAAGAGLMLALAFWRPGG